MDYEKGELITEGKTKKVWEVKGTKEFTIIENKPEITAFDDPEYTKSFEAKAVYATTTTCRVFELLKACGIPVAYEKQLSATEFLVPKCEMIPLEVIARRLAVGSFLKRHPELVQPEGQRPLRFHRLVTEFFLKTTGGKVMKGEQEVFSGLPVIEGKQLEDPFIANPHEMQWKVFHPKKPSWEKGADLGLTARADQMLNPFTLHEQLKADSPEKVDKLITEMSTDDRKAFLVVEKAWAILGMLQIDWKIEFGWTIDGKLVIADVIDNDSWRLRDRKFREVSKQAYRDGESLSEVEAKYGYVADLVSQFRIPMQALVVWSGSPNDKFAQVPYIPGVRNIEIAMSGHKKTHACLAKLEELHRDYPDGGVIIANVGMSNGLGPTLAAHTSWPVISVPATAAETPEDIWSSLRLPSQNPMATVLSAKNAISYALNILAQQNPAAYMERQFAIEELDTGY